MQKQVDTIYRVAKKVTHDVTETLEKPEVRKGIGISTAVIFLITLSCGLFFSFVPNKDAIFAAEYLSNPSFTGGITGWSLSTTTYDSSYYQDTAGSIETSITGKNNQVTGTADQTISATINSTDTVNLGLSWSKQSVNAICKTNNIIVQIEKPTTPGTWDDIWTDTSKPAVGSPTSWTGPSSLDVSSYFTDNGTYSIRYYALVKTAANVANGCSAWFDNTSLDVTAVVSTIDVSGTCDLYDQSTDCVDDGANEIAVAVNGVLQGQTDATVDGAWTISGVTEPADGDIVTVFINGEATASERATAVTKWNTGDGNITGVALYQRHLTIGSTVTDKTFTNTDLQDYDYSASTNDVDVIYDVTDATNDLVLDNLTNYTDETLVVLSGDTYQPDSGSSGNVDTHDLEMNGTITADGNIFTIEGSWDNNNIFTANTSTVTFDATSGSESIDSTGATTAIFNTVNLGSGSGTASWTLGSALDIGGALSINYGTLIQNGANNVNVDGALNIGAGGNFTKATGSAMVFDSGTTQTLTSGGEDMGNIQVSTASTHLDIQDSLIADSVTIDGSTTLDSNSNLIDVGGDWANSGSFLAGTGTVTFSADTGTSGINAGASAFNSVVINDSGGSATFIPIADMTINADFTLTDGVLDLETMDPIMTFGDDVGTGNFTINGGSITPSLTANFILNDNPTIFDDNVGVDLGEVVIGLSPADTVLSSDLKANSITVNTGDALYTCEYDLNAGNGGIQVDGTLDASGSGHASCSSEADETYINTAAGFVLNGSSIFVYDQSTVEFDNPSGTDNLTTLNSTQLYNLIINAAGTIQLQDDLIVTNDLTITAGTLDTVSGSNYPISVAGSWDNNATFAANSGTVTFDSADTGETIEAGSSSFYDVVFNNSGGGWIIQTDELTATDFTITDVSVWALAASRTITVTGIYTIANAETSSTTWNAGSKLFLNGTSQTIGSKTQNAEVYATLEIGANTDIRTWQSGATTEIVDATGSLYSQDHNNVDGDLYIWGDYHTQTDDHWSYATDFEGTAVTRQVDVLIDPSSKVTVDGSYTLASIGTGANRTTVSRQGASNGYELSVLSSGTINFQYTDFDWLDGQLGIDIQAGSTVTSLDYTAYDNLVGAGAADAYITVASTVIGSGTKTITGCQFDNTGTGADFNVNRTGADDTGYWDFDSTTGTFDGEAFDGKDGVNEADPGMLRWDDSTTNTAPNDPSSLVQKKTDDTVLATGDWTDETSVKFTATVSDPDNPDTLYLCVEKDLLGTAFSNTEDLCGTGVAYSGTPLEATVTITGIADASEYHWQAIVKDSTSAYSSWISYDVNLETERDFGIDTTAPTGGTVNDGTGADQDWNDGSLTDLSGNWSGIDSSVAGLDKYEYAIQRDRDDWYWNAAGTTWQSGESWVDNATTTSFTDNTIYLRTGELYTVKVRTTDNAGNVATAIVSNGQQVIPELTFSLNSNTVTFDDLNNGNNWTDTKTSIITSSTNANNGYVIRAYINQLLTSLAYAETIQNFTATWANPLEWSGQCKDNSAYCGFGHTSSDTQVQGSNRYNNGTEYAPYATSGSGDILADHEATIDGSTGKVTNEQFTITHKVSTDSAQVASEYQTILYLIISATF